MDNAGGVVPEVQLDIQYDFEGNRTWMGDSLGGAIGYTWADQRLQSMRMTTEESKSAQVDFTHDSIGRLSSVSRMTNENPATTIKTAYTLDLLDRVMSDARLNANPLVDEAHHKVPPQGFKYLVTEMVCWAAGGPQKYSGRSMADSHNHLNISHGEWLAFMDDVKLTLDKFQVPLPEQKELEAIIQGTYKDIVRK